MTEPDAAALFAAATAILSDLDGTLIDSIAASRRAWHAFAERHGLDPELVHAAAQGRPSRETVRRLAPVEAHERETELLEEAEINDTDGVVALAGAAEIMATTRPFAIVTSCSKALALARLGAARLPVPDVLVTSYDIEHGKPDPECFLLGARQLDVDPAACVVLEDAPAGIIAGRAAGATVIALRSTHADAELGDANAIVDSLTELLQQRGC